MAGFGSGTDFFDIPTLITNTGLKFIKSNTTPASVSVEHAMDEAGIIVGQGDYEGGPATAIECVYDLLSGTLAMGSLYLGYQLLSDPKVVAVSMEIATSNGAWPRLTVSGFTGVTNETTMPTFTLDTVTINALRQAQVIDFAVGADCRLTSSSYSISGEFHHALDADGDVGAMAMTGCTAEISGDGVEIADIVSWTPGATWTEVQAPGVDSANISWATASFSATKFVAET